MSTHRSFSWMAYDCVCHIDVFDLRACQWVSRKNQHDSDQITHTNKAAMDSAEGIFIYINIILFGNVFNTVYTHVYHQTSSNYSILMFHHHHHHLHLNNIKHHHQTSSLFVFRSFPVSDRLGLQSTAGRPELALHCAVATWDGTWFVINLSWYRLISIYWIWNWCDLTWFIYIYIWFTWKCLNSHGFNMIYLATYQTSTWFSWWNSPWNSRTVHGS